jgi:hypothetical protein
MNWQPIETFDRNVSQFVLVHEDGATRLYLWDQIRKVWEHPYPIGRVVDDSGGEMVVEPTHWMPLPPPPQTNPPSVKGIEG